jgi:hypothetical protein
MSLYIKNGKIVTINGQLAAGGDCCGALSNCDSDGGGGGGGGGGGVNGACCTLDTNGIPVCTQTDDAGCNSLNGVFKPDKVCGCQSGDCRDVCGKVCGTPGTTSFDPCQSCNFFGSAAANATGGIPGCPGYGGGFGLGF